jgi:cytochrome c5
MSDAQHDEHHGPIRTPKQLVIAVLAAFVIPIIVIILLVQYVSSDSRTGAGSNTSPEATVARIAPVADQGFTLKDANAPKVLLSGDEVYKSTCAACHASGAAGAPKVGDAGGWSARIAQGYDTVLKHAIEGLRAMPAKGGNPDLDDVEVARAVVFMANQSGGKFKEPAVPAAPAAAAPAAGGQAAAPAAPATAAAAPAAAPAGAKADGKKLYDTACVACHGAGVAGAPKFADKAAWEPRLKQGNDKLYEHAIKGFTGKAGMMPPKGGSSASDEEVKAAVDYMAAAAK